MTFFYEGTLWNEGYILPFFYGLMLKEGVYTEIYANVVTVKGCAEGISLDSSLGAPLF